MKYYQLLFLVFIFGCKASGYKQNSSKLISYLYDNSNKDLNEIRGEVFNIQLKNNSNINLSAAAHNYDDQSVLYVRINKPQYSNFFPNKNIIKVKSSKHGVLIYKPTENKSLQQLKIHFFEKNIKRTNSIDLLKIIQNDTITILIGNNEFKFLSPQFD